MRFHRAAVWLAAFALAGSVAERAHAQEAGAEAASGEAASAQPPPEAEPAPDAVLQEAMLRYEGAVAVFDRGDFGAALAEFDRIYELMEGHPRRYFVLYNIGQCHERLFRYDRAMDAYQRYLDEGGPQAEDRIAVETTIRTLEGLLGAVRVQVNVQHAEVWVGDRQVGEAPGVVRLPAGSHAMEVRAEGFTSVRREIVIAARQLMDQTFELSALSDFRGLDPSLFFIGLGATVASAGVGAGFGIAALQERASVNDVLADPSRRYSLDSDAASSKIRELATIADIFYGIAVGLGVTSIVFAVLTNWSGEGGTTSEGAAWLILPSASPTSLSLSAVGAF